MRKVYISFLGTSNYLACNYYRSGFQSVQGVRFVQEATIQWNCTNWSPDDRVYILTTQDAHDKNWVDNGQPSSSTESTEILGLASRLSRLHIKAPIEEISVPVGSNEEEIWKIFEIAFDLLQEDDELYLDITHAFRSLPLLAMVMINYAKVLKSIKVRAIDYGAIEALGPMETVLSMKVVDRDVPVFDLLPFDKLLDWSMAIDKFVGGGDATAIQKMTTENVTPILKATKGQNKEAARLKKMAKHLGPFTNSLFTCRGKSIANDAINLKCAVEQIENQGLIKPLGPLVDKLSKATSRFSGDEILDGAAAARWCLEHNLIQQGFTLLQETIISYTLDKVFAGDVYQKKRRELVGMAFKIVGDNIPVEKWDTKAKAEQNIAEVNQLCGWIEEQNTLQRCMKDLTSYRNDINHAGINDCPMAAEKFKNKLEEYLTLFEQVIG